MTRRAKMAPILLHRIKVNVCITLFVLSFGGLWSVTAALATTPQNNSCPATKSWNSVAMSLYQKGDYRGAIAATNKDHCKWKDYELLFTSYMAVYLQNPDKHTRDEALEAISEFRNLHVVDGSVDPGPLYVALGDIVGAKSWYQEVVASVKPGYVGRNQRSLKSSRAAAVAALRVLNSRNWLPGEKVQLLRSLAKAIDAVAKQNP